MSTPLDPRESTGFAGGRTLLAVAIAVVTVFLLVTFLWQFALTLIVAGAVYYLLSPLVDAGTRRGVPRLIAIVVSYALLLWVIAFGISVVVPRAYAQLEALAADLPQHAENAERWIVDLGVAGDSEEVRAAVSNLAGQLDQIALDAVGYLVGAVGGLVASLVAIIFGLAAAFYLLLGAPRLSVEASRWIPPRSRPQWARFGRDASGVLAGYLRARLLASVFIGVSYGTAFWLLGIEEALLLGIVGGVLNLVPFIGPLLAAIPALIVAAFHGWTIVAGVLIVMFVAQQVESAVINPHLEGHYVRLHPAVVVLAAAAGAAVAGLPGLLLATPVAGLVRAALEAFYRDEGVANGVVTPLPRDGESAKLAP